MGPLLALLIIVVTSLLIVRLATNALVLTGMSLEAALFQSASAFFGVGFTTSEAEMVVDHPVRRRIILHLIIAGNIGIASALATIVLTFLKENKDDDMNMFLVVGATVLIIIFFAILLNLTMIKRPLDRLMRISLSKAGMRRVVDYELLLNIRDGYQVSDFVIPENHPLAERSLMESRPADNGIIILGVTDGNGNFVGAPHKDVVVHVGDTVMVYGNQESVAAMASVVEKKA